MKEILISFAFIACFATLEYVAGQTEPSPTVDQTTYAPGNVNVRNVCICVVAGYCNLANANSSDDGAGAIDSRIMTTGEDTPPITGANNDSMIATSTGSIIVVTNQTTCATGLELCCPPGGYTCGVVYPPVENAPEAITTQGQAPYGSFPWQAALLSQKNEFIASGALIDQVTVLTAAHKIQAAAVPFKVRLGSWDATGKQNIFKAFEINTSNIIYHPKYNPKNLKYDLAIIRLSAPAPLGVFPTLTNICLPNRPIQEGVRCWVSGWGKGDYGNTSMYSPVIKAIDVPLVDVDKCQSLLRATRLGQNFVLDRSSFICAGGEFAKDACTGDGGAPLSCSIGGYWYLAGLVSWGIGCGQAKVPGVYVNIFNLTSWIQQTNNVTITNNVNTTTAGTTTPSATTTSPIPTTKSGNSTAASTTIKSNSTSVTSPYPADTSAKSTMGPNTTITTPKSGGRIVTTTNVKAAVPTSSTKTTVRTTLPDGRKVGGESAPTPKFNAQTTKSNSTQTTRMNSTQTTSKPIVTQKTTQRVEQAVEARSGITSAPTGKSNATTVRPGPGDDLGPAEIFG